MNFTGIIKKDIFEADLDTGKLVSELLKNKEYKDFHDKSELFDLIIKTIENQTKEIEKLKKQNQLLNENLYFHKTFTGKYFRFLEIGIIFVTLILMLSKIL